MLRRQIIPIADIYVPIKRRAPLEQKRVDEIAASILDQGLQAPILARADGARFVLVEGRRLTCDEVYWVAKLPCCCERATGEPPPKRDPYSFIRSRP
jgi:hypothetical protein